MALGLLATLDCPDCGDVRAFVQPPCADGHGEACPEWCCTDCGAAVFAEVCPPAVARRRRSVA